MDYGLIANKLLDMLEQDLEDIPLSIAFGQEYRKRGQWDSATEMIVRQMATANAEMTEDAAFWSSVWYMYLGAAELTRGRTSWAGGHFSRAERKFRLQHHLHGTMVAVLAQGRAWQLGRRAATEVATIYARCEHLCAELEQLAYKRHDFHRQRTYANTRAWLQDAITMLRQSMFPQLVREFDAVAGEPAYLLADDMTRETATILLEEELLHLRSVDNGRREMTVELNPDDHYFVTHVHGDSMCGTTARGRQIDIRNGDRLLARQYGGWPDNETIGVFKEADRTPLVKIFRHRPRTKILASANPLYGDRIFDEAAPALSYLGPVIAILTPAD